MPSIVTINISATNAATPSFLQETGALISQGATTLAASTYSLLTSLSSLTPLLGPPLAVSSISWAGGTVTVTTSAVIPGLATNDTFWATFAGFLPVGYNGTFYCTVTGASTITFSLVANPGTVVTFGTYTPPNQVELIAMATTFFAQGAGQGVYVLELGAGNGSSGPTTLSTFITANSAPQFFYAYLVPRLWDSKGTFFSLIAQFEALGSKTYFFVTTTLGNYTNYTSLAKCVLALVEAPGVVPPEFTVAADFQHFLNYNPSSANRMTPNAFAYLYGVTPYPTKGNGALLQTLQNANINYVATGAEGGISTAILWRGQTLDGNDITYWYSVDWIQIQADLAISNAVINGNNNPLNPLYYNQQGINTLQGVVVRVVQNGITFGLATGTVAQTSLDGPVFTQNYDDDDYVDQCVVNAVPFINYTVENPNAYAQGLYGGLGVIWIPQRGFQQIIFNINVTSFIAP